MPILARLQMSLIAMYFNDHNPPHFHVLAKDGKEARIRIDGLSVLSGDIDRKALAEALAWARDNEEFLKERWNAFSG